MDVGLLWARSKWEGSCRGLNRICEQTFHFVCMWSPCSHCSYNCFGLFKFADYGKN